MGGSCQRNVYEIYYGILVKLLLTYLHSFIHSGHFYSAPPSPLLLRGAPDYSTVTVSEFHAEAVIFILSELENNCEQ